MASAPQTAVAPPQPAEGELDPPTSASANGAGASNVDARSAHHRLQRYPDRGLLGGVGAGVSEQLGVPVQLIRFALALMLAAGGIGIVLYALAWRLLPVAPESVGSRACEKDSHPHRYPVVIEGYSGVDSEITQPYRPITTT